MNPASNGDSNELVDRVHRLAVVHGASRARPPKDPEFEDAGCDAYAGEAEEPRFAGSDAPAMFDLADLGGRFCDYCGTSIDGARSDASHCSAACRGRDWRREQRSPLDH
jgi:hypothetical protein